MRHYLRQEPYEVIPHVREGVRGTVYGTMAPHLPPRKVVFDELIRPGMRGRYNRLDFFILKDLRVCGLY
jgi:hypothetical protein